MAGRHKVDLPLSFFERFDVEDEKAEQLSAEWTTGSGLVLQAGAAKKRVHGKLGTGLLLRGRVRLGQVVGADGVVTKETVRQRYIRETPRSRAPSLFLSHS